MKYIVYLYLIYLVAFSNGQFPLDNNRRWWEHITTTAPGFVPPISPVNSELADYYYTDDSDICCECVSFYLCSENNTIIVDGGDVIGPRFGADIPPTRVTNVEMCPDITQLCCRPQSAPASCDITNNRGPSDPNTPCSCIHWEFCLDQFRISDGSPSSTFVEGKALPAHASCQHSLEVCCAFEPVISTPSEPSTPRPSPSEQCVCVNPWICGIDGYVITDGTDVIDLRRGPNGPPCVPPMICCKEARNLFPDITTPWTTVNPSIPVTPTIENQQCNGIRNTQGISIRISGFRDSESQFGEFPWVGMILRTYFVAGLPMNAFIGGCIIVHPRVLLTAAHKVANEAVESLTIRVGEWDIETDYEPRDHQVRSVERVIVHPGFNNRSLYHDVAFLILTEPIVLQPHIRSICLASFLEEVDTTACVINGWGKDSFDQNNFQTVMKSITLPLVPHRRCQAMLRRTRLGRWFRLHHSFQCAGGLKGLDACSSDGGGPLACPRIGSSTREYLLVGITAWGIGCGEDGVPGVYASTVADHRWISAKLEELYPGHSVVRRDAEETSNTTNDLSNEQQFDIKTTQTVPTTSSSTTTKATTTTPYFETTIRPLETRRERRQRERRQRGERQRQGRQQRMERERRRREERRRRGQHS